MTITLHPAEPVSVVGACARGAGGDWSYPLRRGLEQLLVPVLALLLAAAAFRGLPAGARHIAGRVRQAWSGAARSAAGSRSRTRCSARRRCCSRRSAWRCRRSSVSSSSAARARWCWAGSRRPWSAPAARRPVSSLLVMPSWRWPGAGLGAAWIGLTGWLRAYRGINETIASLLLAYIAMALFNHLVEGPLRDPAQPQQAVHHADRRRQHARHDAGHRHASGPGGRRHRLRRLLGLIYRTSFGFACARHRRQSARGAAAGAAGAG